jgi:SHS family lactate transporter-like MFS transporter
MFDALKGWTSAQKHVVAASYLGWTLDAFDFFLLVFVLKDVASTFHAPIAIVTIALTLTLGFRAIGAFIFGRLADRYGRRPILMIDVAIYSALALATAFSPNLIVFFVLRALFGIAMGGEWGVGASLTMETVRPASRGLVSGILQSGYPCGYLLASVVFAVLYPTIGWRGMFMVGVIPALLILYIRRHVPESPGWSERRASSQPAPSLAGGAEAGMLALYLASFVAAIWLLPTLGVWSFAITLVPMVAAVVYFRGHWKIALFAIVLMTAFNFFSHGTQDLYPTFLQVQRHFDHTTVSLIAIVYNVGAIVGGILFGALSQRYGRRRMMAITAVLSIAAAPLWAFAPSALLLGVGAFLMQFFVQGCWGIVPAYLNEISPPDARGTFPGTVYQLGNFIAASNAPIQAAIAGAFLGRYSIGLVAVAIAAAIVIAVLTAFGREARDIDLTQVAA